jgi:hypothetical protein
MQTTSDGPGGVEEGPEAVLKLETGTNKYCIRRQETGRSMHMQQSFKILGKGSFPERRNRGFHAWVSPGESL